MKKPIAVFLKFGYLEHLEEFRKGSLYLRSLSYFQNLESDQAKRSDPNEGVQGVYQPKEITVSISIDGHIHELGDLAGPVIVVNKALDDVHAFCLFALTPGEYEVEDQEHENGFLKLKFDSSFNLFGGHVLVASAGRFIERVAIALKKRGLQAHCDLVEYIKESEFHGDIPESRIGFYKLDDFKHQREYRIITYNTGSPNKPIRIEIGDLSDITQIIKFDELDVKLKKNP